MVIEFFLWGSMEGDIEWSGDAKSVNNLCKVKLTIVSSNGNKPMMLLYF